MKKLLLASAISLIPAISNALWVSDDERLSLGADAEINFDIIDNQHGITSESITSFANRGSTLTQLNDDSRIKFILKWQNKLDGGRYVMAEAQPLFRTDATYAVDDVYLKVGHQDLWAFQIGRFEALDLFPLGKDTAVFYAAGSDGIGSGVYYYMAKEGRGRRNEAGQARIISENNNWTGEVAAIYGNTAELLTSSEIYLNNVKSNVISNSNSFLVRPAVNYKSDSGFFSISLGGEYEIKKDSAEVILKPTADTTTEKRLNLSDRYGLAATTTLNFSNGLRWNNSVAQQDSKHLWKILTGNTNIVYKDAYGLGVSYTKNDFKEKEQRKDANSYVVYAAYTAPIFDLENAQISYALSYSETKNAFGKKMPGELGDMDFRNERRAAFRVRFNYYL